MVSILDLRPPPVETTALIAAPTNLRNAASLATEMIWKGKKWIGKASVIFPSLRKDVMCTQFHLFMDLPLELRQLIVGISRITLTYRFFITRNVMLRWTHVVFSLSSWATHTSYWPRWRQVSRPVFLRNASLDGRQSRGPRIRIHPTPTHTPPFSPPW